MKKQTAIYILNIATVIFAILTVVSIGSLMTLPVYTVMVNTVLFSLLTYTCYTKEMALRLQMQARRRKAKLSVYAPAHSRRAA